MSKHDTGGPARDKTLWDYFAGQALANLLADPTYENANAGIDETVGFAYDYAQAMISEKRRRQPKEQEVDPESVDHRWRVCPHCQKWAPMPSTGKRPTDKREHLRCGRCGHMWYAKIRGNETSSRSGNHRRSVAAKKAGKK